MFANRPTLFDNVSPYTLGPHVSYGADKRMQRVWSYRRHHYNSA